MNIAADHEEDLHCNCSCTSPQRARHCEKLGQVCALGALETHVPEDGTLIVHIAGFEDRCLGLRQSCHAVEQQIGVGNAFYGPNGGCQARA